MTKIPSESRAAQLVDKFRTQSLSPEELNEFKTFIAMMSDEEVANMFEQHPDTKYECHEMPKELFERIISGIERRAIAEQALCKTAHRRRLITVAATIAIPLLCVVAWLGINLEEYSRYNDMLASDTQLTTSDGETARLQLPDGSDITLGSNSHIKYSLKDFNDKLRVINGLGDISLNVAHNSKCPFILKSDGLEVRVLGTKFSLMAKTDAPAAMLYLEEGSVEMKSTVSGEVVVIKPHELVAMNYTTGSFTIEHLDAPNDARARLRGDISFKGISLMDVLNRLSDTYHKEFTYEEKYVAGKTFTGYLPTTNIYEAINIICEVFHLEAYMGADKITLKQR